MISGPGIPGNTFIKSITATTAVLNHAVGSPGVANGAHLTVNNSDGRTVIATVFSGTSITAPTAHFCKAGLSGCNTGASTKSDIGRTISGTRIPHGTTITAVGSNSAITISQAAIACPATVPAANCNQLGVGSLPSLTTSRQVKDATFVSPNKVCSATAGFSQTDVNLPIASVSTPAKFPAGDYITGVGATGCPGGTVSYTHLTLPTILRV